MTSGASAADVVAVRALLGREPRGRLRGRRPRRRRRAGRGDATRRSPATGRRCPPASGSSTPTRHAVSRLEAAGGVRAAEAAVDPDELVAAHAALRGRARRRRSPRARRAAPVRWRRGDTPRREVPPRALRVVPRGRRRSGGALGRGRRASSTTCREPRRGRRHRHELGPSARRRSSTAGATRPIEDDRPADAHHAASAKGSTPHAVWRRRRSSERSSCSGVPRGDRRATGSTRTRATATSAARDAANRDAVLPRRHRGARLRSGAPHRRRGGAAVVPRRDRRARRCPAPLPRRRHRWRVDRVRARHPRAGGAALGRHRLRARHRAVAALRSARTRGALERGVGGARPPRRGRARDARCSSTPRRSSGSRAR